jgi:hypothetical protein
MIQIDTYLMKSLKLRDKEKYPIVTPKDFVNNPSDFFIPIRNLEDMVEYFGHPQRTNKSFINSVMVIKSEDQPIVNFDMWTLNVWFDFLVGLREFLKTETTSFYYGHDPVIPMEWKIQNNKLLFIIDGRVHHLDKSFLYILINEIEYVILTLQKTNIYSQNSKLYTIPNLLTDMKEMKLMILEKYM